MTSQFDIEWHETLASTNTYMQELLEKSPDLRSGKVIAAREQTQGRGRLDRTWLSGINENLTFSLYLRTETEPRRLPAAAMAAALGVATLLEEEGIQPALKWPNDVLVQGRKICGILSEAVSGGVIIGIGLNVNMENTGHIDQPATSMLIESGIRRDREPLLLRLLDKLVPHLTVWEKDGFSGIRENWECRVQNLGNPIRLRDGATVREGVLAGFGEEGELLLRSGDSTLTPIWCGELG